MLTSMQRSLVSMRYYVVNEVSIILYYTLESSTVYADKVLILTLMTVFDKFIALHCNY